ncbi:MAG TPA: ABC transporter substrate-binding protein [Stellaceae bacterium]|nr:ABC transporter substrate-binding protein [Stellaceae bacterium]
MLKNFGWVLVGSMAAAIGVATPAVADKASGTLRLAADQPVQTVSYYYDPAPDTVLESEAVYDGLVSYDVGRGEVEPLLAKAWRRIDPQTLEFDLRDDVTWQDGTKFTAADVLYTLNFLADPKTVLRFKQDWSWIDKVEQLGDDKIRVHAKQPTPYDLTRFAYVTTILPEHQPGSPQDKGYHPIGTGPYRATQVDDARGIVLERNDGFRHGNPAKPGSNIQRISMQPIPDEGTRIAQLLAGNLDMIDASLEQAQNLAQDPRFEMSIVQGASFMYVAYDAQGRSGAKPVTDERVRRALTMAIDRTALLKLVAGDATLRQPEAMCWRSQAGCDYSLPLPAYDRDGAKKLLAEAGYPDGFDIEITSFAGLPTQIAEAVAGQWHAVGVTAKIDPLAVVSYRAKQQAGKIQVMVAAWPAGNIPDVSATVDSFFAAGPADYSGDQELHQLAADSDAAMDPAARKAIGRKLFDRATDKFYFLPLTPYPTVLVHTREVAVAQSDRFTPLGYEVSDLNWR